MNHNSSKYRYSLLMLLLGGLLTTSSIESIFGISDSDLKILGSIIIILAFLMAFEFSDLERYQIPLTLVLLLYSSFLLTELIFAGNAEYATTAFFRMILSCAILLISLKLSATLDHEIILKCIFYCGLFIATLAIVYQYLDLERGEYIPIIDIFSVKGIVHEQNVYGICLFLSLVAGSQLKNNIFLQLSRLITYYGLFISYFRTVYILAFIFLASLRIKLIIAALICIVYFKYDVYEMLQLQQASTLTGRDDLWLTGLKTFLDHPFGVGESAIPSITSWVGHYYTTLHNSIIDSMVMGGIIGLICYILLIFFFSLRFKGFIFTLFIIIAPSFFNTYFPFAPNLAGIFAGLLISCGSRKVEK